MVKGSYNQKPYRKDVMRTFGASVIASPSASDTTEAGRKILANDPNTTGSLGCAISEAVERAVTTPNCRYVLGSVLNQVLLHQSVIGLESYEALMEYGEYPESPRLRGRRQQPGRADRPLHAGHASRQAQRHPLCGRGNLPAARR